KVVIARANEFRLRALTFAHTVLAERKRQNGPHAHFSRAGRFYPLIARQMRSGVAGPAKSETPKGASASRIALVTAGKAPIAPASPQPLTPSGLVVQRVPLKPRS